jgi:predicted negative regulator of RcsB-dependent stress response
MIGYLTPAMTCFAPIVPYDYLNHRWRINREAITVLETTIRKTTDEEDMRVAHLRLKRILTRRVELTAEFALKGLKLPVKRPHKSIC